MSAAVPCQKRDAVAGQFADHQVVGRRAEWRLHDNFFLRFEAGHGVETAPAYDAYLYFQFATSLAETRRHGDAATRRAYLF